MRPSRFFCEILFNTGFAATCYTQPMVDTLNTVCQLLVEEFDLPADQLAADTAFETLGLDSITVVEFMFMVEERFKLKLDLDAEPGDMKTIGDVAREIDKLLALEAG